MEKHKPKGTSPHRPRPGRAGRVEPTQHRNVQHEHISRIACFADISRITPGFKPATFIN